MATDTRIPLQSQGPDLPSTLDVMKGTLSIQDMIQTRRTRGIQQKEAEIALQQRQSQIADQEKQQKAQQAKEAAWKANTKWDDDEGLQIDTKGMMKMLAPEYPEIAAEIQAGETKLQESARTQSLKQWEEDSKVFKQLGAMFEAEDVEANKAEYNSIPPNVKAALDLPQAYSPEAVEFVRATAKRRLTTAEKKLAAEAEKIEAETKKIESEAEAQKTQSYPPGTLIITRDKDGKETKRETVPAKETEDKPSDKQREVELVEEAYGQVQLKGKPRDKMTAAEKVAAARWNDASTARANPNELTDQQRLMQLYRSGKPEDMALFNALKGNIDDGPTVSNKAAMLNTLLDSAKGVTGKIDRELFDKNRQLYLQIWPDIPGFDVAVKTVPASMGDVRERERTPPKATPPASKKIVVKAPNGKDYAFDTQAQAEEFKKRIEAAKAK